MFWIFKSNLDIAPSNGGRASVTRDKTRTMKKVDFLKTPKLGDIIKVYESSGYYFGICKGTTYIDRLITRRQVAIVERVMDTYSLTECNFFLESEKVVEL
jgi:hypothetical protein